MERSYVLWCKPLRWDLVTHQVSVDTDVKPLQHRTRWTLDGSLDRLVMDGSVEFTTVPYSLPRRYAGIALSSEPNGSSIMKVLANDGPSQTLIPQNGDGILIRDVYVELKITAWMDEDFKTQVITDLLRAGGLQFTL